jgi:hypothetical protein
MIFVMGVASCVFFKVAFTETHSRCGELLSSANWNDLSYSRATGENLYSAG